MTALALALRLSTSGLLGEATPPVIPTVVTDPEIDNLSPARDDLLEVSNGTWANLPTGYAYQWYRDGVAISGETSATYTVTSDDLGAELTAGVVASNGAGDSTEALSDPTTEVVGVPLPTVSPAVTGTAQEGETLTTTNGTWGAYPAPTYARQWKRYDASDVFVEDIAGETGTTYDLVADDVGFKIGCTVTATNSEGDTDEDSNLTAVVTGPMGPIGFIADEVSSTATVNVPAGTLSGHTMIVLVFDNSVANLSLPGGWTRVVSDFTMPVLGYGVMLAKRTAGGSEPGSYNFGTAGAVHGSFILTYENVTTVSAPGGFEELVTPPLTSTGISTTTPNILLALLADRDPNSMTAPSGMTPRVNSVTLNSAMAAAELVDGDNSNRTWTDASHFYPGAQVLVLLT